jgi:arylsulfatase A-like enzyme
MNHGYRAVGAGKIFHHHFDSAFHDAASFHDFLRLAKDPAPPRKLNGITNWVGGRGGGRTSPPFDWGPWPPDEAQTPDAKTVDYACRFLAQQHAQPFFLAVGIFRPHSPWYAPAAHFEDYPLDQLVMPKVLKGDIQDLPSGGRKMLQEGKPFLYKTIVANDQLQEAIQAYQACAAYADEQIGRVLDALARTAYVRNTIIILWSDHGFHLGEKQHWEKFALWEKSTRAPLIIVAPSIAKRNARCDRPVSLLDIYPTLVELCHLSPNQALEGISLVPLLRDPQAERGRPAVTTWGRGNHSVRSQRWRYIKYQDGTDELYDHRNDSHEWFNLSGDSRYADIIRDHKKWLPKHEAQGVSDMERPPSPVSNE